jgi:hypothetical protein
MTFLSSVGECSAGCAVVYHWEVYRNMKIQPYSIHNPAFATRAGANSDPAQACPAMCESWAECTCDVLATVPSYIYYDLLKIALCRGLVWNAYIPPPTNVCSDLFH